MKKSLIIFDLDGTLIDSVPDLADGVNGMLDDFHQAPVSVEQVRGWVGNGSIKLVERALTWVNLPMKNLPHAHEAFLHHYAHCQGKTVEYDGVSDGLRRLFEAGFILALCTNKPARFLPDILNQMGWTEYFACVVGGDSLSVKKPDPTPLQHICTTLGIPTSRAVMVGDSMNDVLAGQRANMTTLALSYGYNYDKPIKDSCPDQVFDAFGELVAYIIKEYHHA